MNNDWIYRLPDYNRAVRKAMKLWRAENPQRAPYTKVLRHSWHGHVLWNTEDEAGVLATVPEVLTKYRTEIEK